MPKISALPAAAAITADDLFAIVNDPGGVPVTQKATGTQLLAFALSSSAFTEVLFNDTNVLRGDASFLYNSITDVLQVPHLQLPSAANSTSISVTGYSLTGANAQSMLALAGTWNTTGSPVGIRLAITDTASNAASKMLELIGGAGGATSLFSVNKAGQVILSSGTNALPSLVFSADAGLNTGIYRVGAARIGFSTAGTLVGEWNNNTLELKAGIQLNWNSDLKFERDAANEFGQRNGATAQVHRIYRTFTNSTNYERAAIQSGAGYFEFASETAGTGTDNIDVRLTPAGTGLLDVRTAATIDAAVASTHTVRVKFNGTEFKVLLATP
jgi:hypothetical protein